jgi:glycosyltransferase involved in cell wall biosynthesis
MDRRQTSEDQGMRFVVTRRESFNQADGINAFVLALSEALIEAGHEVFGICGQGADESKVQSNFPGYRYTGLHSLLKDERATPKEIMAEWRRSGLDLVRSIKPDFVIVNGALPVRMPFPSCILSHDLERRWSYGSFARRLYKMYAYRKVDAVVATCSELRLALAKELMISAESISVIPTCVDLKTYENAPLEQREPAILHMGMPAYKNPAATIAAFAGLKTHAKLYLTGNASPEVKEQIAGLPKAKQDCISLLGIVPGEELKRLLGHIRVLSVPSEYVVPVASPTVLDGLASGTPVIGTMGISTDLIVDGESGFRASPQDIAGLTAKMELLLTDDAAWRQMSQGGSVRAERFDHHAVAAAYVKVAEQTIAKVKR